MTKDNGPHKTSPAYRLPALDSDFLLGDSMRGVRLQLEYEKAEEIRRAWTVRSTIVAFGSARVRHGNPWYEEARNFGRIASEFGGALNIDGNARNNVIATGGDRGSWKRPTAAPRRQARQASASTLGCQENRSQMLTRHPN